MYVCMCVYAPEAINNYSGVILTLYDWLNNCVGSSVSFMALVVDIINRRDPSNETSCQL